MPITKEEISLCRQIAEKYRKEIIKGDWWHRNKGENPGYPAEVVLVIGEGTAAVFNDISNHKRLYHHGFPFWTISDCLEFLDKRMYTFERAVQLGSIFNVSFISVDGKQKKGSGDTMLEACLKAVLAI